MKNKFHIQKIEIKDIDKLNKISAELNKIHVDKFPDIFHSVQEAYNEKTVKDLLNNPQEGIIGAYIVDELVGFVRYTIQIRSHNKFIKPEEILKINELAVEQDSKGLGVGTELINEVKKIARDNKISKIILSVWTFNKQACDFYENYGFENVKQEMQLDI